MKQQTILSISAASLLTGGLLAQNVQFVPTTALNASSLPAISTTSSTIAVTGDLDGDGDQDIVYGLDTAPASGPSIRIQRNGTFDPVTGSSEAYGAFTVWAPATITTRDQIFDIEVFDADNDGDGDILFVTSTVQGAPTLTQVALLRQIAPGVFSAPQFVYGSQTTIPVTSEIADMNGDGRIDVVVGLAPPLGGTGGVVLMTNNGFGFTANPLGAAYAGMWCGSLAVGDVDGDGDLDIVTGNVAGQGSNRQNAIYRNNGGVFSASTAGMPFNSADTTDILLANISGSSLPELIVSDRTANKTVHANVSGSFTTLLASFPGAGFIARHGGAAGDIDLDGDIDLVFSHPTQNTEVFVNFAGTLVASPTRITADGPSGSTVLCDMDRDADVDIVQGLHSGVHFGTRAQINLHRQLDAPIAGRIGTTLVVDYYDRPGYGNGHAPTLHLSPAPLVPRLAVPPFGFLGIDLSVALIVSLPLASSGKNSLPVNLPAMPSLIGQTWYWQWVLAPNTGNIADWGLTNVVPLSFLP